MADEISYSLSINYTNLEDSLDINWDDSEDGVAGKSGQFSMDVSTSLAQITLSSVSSPKLLAWKVTGTNAVQLFAGNTTNQVGQVSPGNIGFLTINSSCDIRHKTASGTSIIKVALISA